MSVRREDSLTVGEDQDSVSFWFVVLLTLPAFALLAVLSLRYDTPQSACILGDPPFFAWSPCLVGAGVLIGTRRSTQRRLVRVSWVLIALALIAGASSIIIIRTT